MPDIPTDEAQPLPTQPGERPTGEPRGTSEVNFGQQALMLYFADSSTNTMLVPITRGVSVRASQVATAAVRELIEGPQGRLTPVIHPEARLLPEASSAAAVRSRSISTATRHQTGIRRGMA